MAAGTPCVGFDSVTQGEAPRSLADFLESHISALKQAGSGPSRPQEPLKGELVSPAASTASSALYEKSTFADGLVNHVVKDITPAFLGITKAKPILSCVVRGTQLPSRRGPVMPTDLNENHPRSILNPSLSSALDGIDHVTTNKILATYLDRIILLYPIYHRTEIRTAFNAIFHPRANVGRDTPKNRFIVSLVMAISFSTCARAKQSDAYARAHRLVQDAMQLLPEVLTNDLSGLQALLLLTQYTFLDPSMADLWLLTGLISQAVIDLGLHQELPNRPHVTGYQRDMRHRLFWVAWEMEVAVCSIFNRPISLPILRYEIPFPLEVDDDAITPTSIDLSGRSPKILARRIWLFRQIEAEVISVLHQQGSNPVEGVALQDWIRKMRQSISDWHAEIYTSAQANRDPTAIASWDDLKIYADIAYPYIILLLCKPSKRITQPSRDEWLDAFENAVRVAKGYTQQANADTGSIKYVFHPCHHSFSAALIFLQALTRCSSDISTQYSRVQVEEWMKVFSYFFSTVSERWPAASRCLEEYERLLEPTKHQYLSYLNEKEWRSMQGMSPLLDQPNSVHSIPPMATTELDDAFNYYETFNPVITSVNGDALSSPMFAPPHDWNSEFNFNFGAHAVSGG